MIHDSALLQQLVSLEKRMDVTLAKRKFDAHDSVRSTNKVGLASAFVCSNTPPDNG